MVHKASLRTIRFLATLAAIFFLAYPLNAGPALAATGTRYIRDDATGGDCQAFGDWNAGTKTCTMTRDLTDTIEVASNNVTLDGNGHTLTGSNTGNGVYLNARSGVTVKNLTVRQFDKGIYLNSPSGGAGGNTLTANTVSNNGWGIYLAASILNRSGANTLTGNTADANAKHGVYVYSSDGNTLTGNRVTGTKPTTGYGAGIRIEGSSNSILTGNVASGNATLGIRINGGNGHNLTDNVAGSNKGGGISVDAGGSTLAGNTASNNGEGWPDAGIYAQGSNLTITNNTTSGNNGLGIYLAMVRDSTVAGNIVTGTNSSESILLASSSGNSLTGNTATNGSVGIHVNGSDGNAISGNTTSGNAHSGIRIAYSDNNTLAGNTINANGDNGIVIWVSSGNTLTRNNVANNMSHGVDYGLNISHMSNNNTVYNNVFYNNGINRPQAHQVPNSSNVFNLPAPVGGNYWSDWQTPDANNDGFVDSPYVFPGGQDNLPWVRQGGWLDNAPPVTTDDAPLSWRRAPFTVTLTCTDNASGSGCKETKYRVDGGAWQTGNSVNVSTEGDHLLEYYSTDNAGNQEAPRSVRAKLDTTAPVLQQGPIQGTAGSDGWYRSDVIVSFTASDALSGLLNPGDAAFILTASQEGGASNTLVNVVYDRAGNSSTAGPLPFKIDRTPPVTTASAVPAWSNADVTVSLNASDNLSGAAVTYYRLDGGATQSGTSILVSLPGIHIIEFWSEDRAGNVEAHQTLQVRIDKTPPTINHSQAPAPNAYGWNNSSVTVTFTCTDDLSGVLSCTAPQTLTTEGRDQPVTGTAVDNAGNSASDMARVSIDLTAPTISGAPDRSANIYGWYSADVTISFACVDALSGVATCSGSTTLGQGAHQSVTGNAADKAGNTASFTVSEINIDKTKPEISISGQAIVLQGATQSATVVASDALSGLVSDPSGQLALDTSAPGAKTVSITVADRSGNSASASFSYTVWGVDGPFAPVVKNGNGTGQFKAGSSIPVKFRITSGNGLITSATGTVSIGGASAPFRWDATGNQYVANVKTASATGAFPVTLNVDGVGSAVIAGVTLR